LCRGKKFKLFLLQKSNATSQAWSTGGGGRRRDLLVATPMRLVHLLRSGGIDLSSVEHLFLDEADRLFELGFLEQVLALSPSFLPRSSPRSA